MTDLNAAYHKRTCEQLLAEGRATASRIRTHGLHRD